MQELDIGGLLTRPGTYVLGVVVYVIIFLLRRIVESVWPSLKKQVDANTPGITYLTSMSRWWNEVILYFLPVIVGSAFGMVKSDFFFAGIVDRSGRILFGLVVGWFSSFLYKVLRKIIKVRTGLDIDDKQEAKDD